VSAPLRLAPAARRPAGARAASTWRSSWRQGRWPCRAGGRGRRGTWRGGGGAPHRRGSRRPRVGHADPLRLLVRQLARPDLRLRALIASSAVTWRPRRPLRRQRHPPPGDPAGPTASRPGWCGGIEQAEARNGGVRPFPVADPPSTTRPATPSSAPPYGSPRRTGGANLREAFARLLSIRWRRRLGADVDLLIRTARAAPLRLPALGVRLRRAGLHRPHVARLRPADLAEACAVPRRSGGFGTVPGPRVRSWPSDRR